MIRLWFSRGTSIPIREQLGAQLILGILSRRLAPGERLPSVRELARRLHLHANTISATYQELAKQGWVSRRRGTGVFVRDLRMTDGHNALELFVSSCVEEGLARGFSLDALHSTWEEIARQARARKFLIVDPDRNLARIMAAEISEATGRVLPFAGCDEACQALTSEICVLVSESQASGVLRTLGRVNHRTIRLNSMQDLIAGHQRPGSEILIAVVSRSESILNWASTLLSALGFPPGSVLRRNPQAPRWQDGLAECDIVAADLLAAAEVSKRFKPTVFKIVSKEFLTKISELVTA